MSSIWLLKFRNMWRRALYLQTECGGRTLWSLPSWHYLFR